MSGYEEEVLGKVYDHVLMRRLLKYTRPYTKQIVVAILALLLVAGLQLIQPRLTQIGIDEYISTGDIGGLKWIIALYAMILLTNFFVHLGRQYLMEWIGQQIMFSLRRDIFGTLQHLPLSFYNRTPVGRLITRVTTDVQSLNELFTSGLVAIFSDIIILIGIIILMLSMNWQLALAAMVVLPILFVATFIFKRKVRDVFRMIRTRIARINSYMQENISGMAVVQIFNREQKNFEQFDKLNASHLDAFLKTIFYFAVFFPLVSFIGALSTAIIIWYGGGQIIAGELTFGGLVAFLQYSTMFFRPISDLSEKLNILQAAMAASERVFSLLDEKPEEDSGSLILPPDYRCRGEITFENVWFAYQDENWILKDISLEINAGEKVAIVGATGAGKSTIINLIARFYTIQKGRITLDGRNIKDYELQSLRRQIGIVLQDVFLFAGTIADNISLGNPELSREKIVEAARYVNALDFIEKLPDGFDTEVKERGATLSVGQKQLLSFARALAFNPSILILDEATSSIDTESEILIQKAMEKLIENRTSIIIAHRLSTIQNADKIVVLHKGEIREIGSHSELLRLNGLYARLYELQFIGQEVRTG